MTARARRRPQRRGRLLRIAVRLVPPLLLVVVLWKLGDPNRLVEAIRQASLWPLLGVLVLNGPVNHFRIMRWQALLKTRGYRYSIRQCWKAVLPSLYLGAVTPGRVGDVLRIQYLSHDLDAPYSEGLAVTVMDRFCDLYVLVAFVALGIGHFANVLHGQLAYVTWAAVSVAALAPLTLMIPGLAEKLMGAVYARLAKDKSTDGLDRFLRALRAQLGKVLFAAVALAVLAYLTTFSQGWLIGQALGLSLSFIDVAAMMAITNLLSLMPISMSGLGVRELFLAALFPVLGWSVEQGVLFGLLVFAGIFLFNVVAGFIAWQIVPPPFRAGEQVVAHTPTSGR